MRSAVVLPQPDGPTNTTNSPSCTSRFKSETASVPSPYVFVTSSNVIPAIGLLLYRAGRDVHDPALEDEEQDCVRDRHQRRGRELERIAVPASELAGCELRHALGQRVETRALRGDDEVRELVPRSLEGQDEERDQRRPRHWQHDRPVD